MNFARTVRVVALFLILGIPPLHAQENVSNDITLSLLRGTWVYHTYREKWTLNFESDTDVLINQNPAVYTLLPGILQIDSAETRIQYRYKLEGDLLTLTFSDGTQRTFDSHGGGDAEQHLHGTYFSEFDHLYELRAYWPKEHHHHRITFRNEREFIIHTEGEDSTENEGVYRIVDNDILLTFYDGTLGEAFIRSRDEDGYVTAVMYHSKLYRKSIVVVRNPRPDPPPCYDCPPPPCLNCGDPPPLPCVDCPIPTPDPVPSPSPQPTNDPQNGGRTIGNTRQDTPQPSPVPSQSGGRQIGDRRDPAGRRPAH
jgi:hypothetical protein